MKRVGRSESHALGSALARTQQNFTELHNIRNMKMISRKCVKVPTISFQKEENNRKGEGRSGLMFPQSTHVAAPVAE